MKSTHCVGTRFQPKSTHSREVDAFWPSHATTKSQQQQQQQTSRQPAQQQQQHQQTSSIGRRPAGPEDPCNYGMGPRCSASKLSQIRDPSPLWKLPSPKEQIHKYKRVTIRHSMGTTQNMCYRSIQSILRHPCGVHTVPSRLYTS